jgi:antibiotic biosynthesis monooxygenase (ABM) superfamily enzyme
MQPAEFPIRQVFLTLSCRRSYSLSRSLLDEAWKEKIGRVVATQPGFVRLVREPRSLLMLDGSNTTTQERAHTVYVTFESLATLNDWMTSPIRQRLVEELTPWLESDHDAVQQQLVAKRRLPDAWTDLLVRQGEFVPPRPPQKWKVIWLTTCGLFISVLLLQRILPYYYEKWGVVQAHERLVAFLDTLFATFVVSYIMQPVRV